MDPMKRLRAMRNKLWPVTAACAIVLASCATTDYVTGRSVNNMYSLHDDVNLGRNAYADIIKSMRDSGVNINRDRTRVQQLEGMVSRIAMISHLPDLPYEVTLFQTNVVNAAALPGGKLIVFEGLYDSKNGLVRDEDELAAVIGHEIAHVTCRHSTEAMTRQLPVNILFAAGLIWADHKEKDDVSNALAGAFLLYKGLLLPKYSRAGEFEADRVGLSYMARAGYDPRAAIRVWRRADEREGNNWGLLNLLASHPDNKSRQQALQAALPQALAEYRRGQRP